MTDPATIASDRHVSPEAVNDRAKLTMHRLIARRLVREPHLLNDAKAVVRRLAADYPDSAFPAEWQAILDLPPGTVRRKLTSRGEEMQRLRLSSPFVAGASTAFLGDPDLRRRIWRLASKGMVEGGNRLSAQM